LSTQFSVSTIYGGLSGRSLNFTDGEDFLSRYAYKGG